MLTADPDTDTDTTSEAGDAAPRRRRRGGRRQASPGFVVATILAAAFLASTVVLAAVAVRLKDDKDALAGGAQVAGDAAAGTSVEVADVAGRLVEALLGYDHRDPEGSRAAVLALAADPFTGQFEEALPQLQESLAAAQSLSTVTIRDVYVGEVTGDTANAVVEYDRIITNTGGEATESSRYMRLGLVRLDTGWRVNDVRDVNVVQVG